VLSKESILLTPRPCIWKFNSAPYTYASRLLADMRLVPESTSLCNLLISRLHHTARISPREEVTCNRDSARFKRFCLLLKTTLSAITSTCFSFPHLPSMFGTVTSSCIGSVTRFSHEYFGALYHNKDIVSRSRTMKTAFISGYPTGCPRFINTNISLYNHIWKIINIALHLITNPLLKTFIIMSWIEVGKSSMGKPCIIKHKGSKPAKTDKPTQPTKLADISAFDHGQPASDPAKKPAKIIYGSWLRNV
jgi:hypothetical protein